MIEIIAMYILTRFIDKSKTLRIWINK